VFFLFWSPVVSDWRRNLELKARHADLMAARAAALGLGARPASIEEQTDTYFRAANGRLKLREIAGQSAVLIFYDRPDERSARLSGYLLVPVPEPALLKSALTAALGVRSVVCKRREILLWHNIRIHLDEVAALGTFVEFEAVLGKGDDESAAAARLEELAAVLKIRAADQLAASYADLLG
jgi:predicted adenylyl cyclase CyaB